MCHEGKEVAEEARNAERQTSRLRMIGVTAHVVKDRGALIQTPESNK